MNDGFDDSVAQSTTITVTAVNDEPTVTSPIPDVTVNEDAADTAFSLYPNFQDPEYTDAQLYVHRDWQHQSEPVYLGEHY